MTTPQGTPPQGAPRPPSASALVSSVVINVPGTNALVKAPDANPGEICATGSASAPSSGASLDRIVAKRFAPGSNVPADPTNEPGVQQGAVNGDDWEFLDPQLIGGVAHGNASPYPQNLLAVWAYWSSDEWTLGTKTFGGITSNQTDCD